MTRSRNPKGHGQRLRDEVITAGMRVLADAADAHQVTIRAVAQAAGVTPPAIYLYFPDRAALLRAIIERGFRMFDAHLAESIEGTDDPAARLRLLCHAYLGFAAAHPGVYRVVFSAAGVGPAELGVAEGADHPGRASLTALIGTVAACTPPGGDRAIRLWCFLHGLADLRLTKPELDWSAADRMIDSTLADLHRT